MHFDPQRFSKRALTELNVNPQSMMVRKSQSIKEKVGTTEIKKINNVPELIKSATMAAATTTAVKPVTTQKTEEPQVNKLNAPANNAPKQSSESTNYYNVITETLENAGIDADDTLKDKILVKIVEAYVNGELDIDASISMVTQLIDINLKNTNSDNNNTLIITKLIDQLLSDKGEKTASMKEVQDFILNVANEILGTGAIEEPAITTPSVNLDAFFKGGETLTAYQIYNDKYAYMYSDDTVSQEIMNSINDVARKLGIQVQPKEYQNLLNCIIAKINDICGVENTNPPVLAKSTLNKYFETYSMDDLKALIKSPEIENAYYQEALNALGLDDIFGEVNQNRKQGDCYFLSTLYSIANTPNGAALLAEAFGTVEIDGVTHYTFTFKGGYRNKNGDESANNYCTKTTTYTFSPKEILEAAKSGKYSSGDINYLVAELAFEALMKDQVYNNEPNTAYDNGYLANGTGVQVMFLLTGVNNTQYTSSGQEFKNFVMSLIRNGSIEEGTTGNYMMYFGFNGHAHAVVGVSAEGVTYIDPYNSSEKLFMSWETILNNPSIYKNFQWAYIPSSSDSQTQNYSDWYNW